MNYEWELQQGRTPVEVLLDMLRAYFPGVDFGNIDDIGDGPTPRRRSGPARRAARQRPVEQPETRRRPANPEPDPVIARCYAELGVPYGADFQQVRRAWRRLMRQHHPDLQGEDAERQRIGTEQAKRFNNAFAEIVRWLRGGQGGTTHA
jgi:hypothetical protein